MADIKKDIKAPVTPVVVKNITITVTSTKVKAVEALCTEVKENGKKKGVQVKGPVRIPTKTLRITTRKTPCGEGSKTWDHYQMRIYKRVLTLKTTPELVKEITSLKIEPGVELEVAMFD
ncbi:40S ribosomal protein S20, putative [Entamoeba dispar SAW760]|uniref:Small ribosomal subunit protein uS10 n=1 Tax=Entamoeba dispar (strain ATCC PRA-260 / SAW760) TaxID=370354 RepID=B0ESE4_ENTDS|nr:40S ribosomal protein S20, putative [Entamoeba dispar SAW760]EDR22568.1 40S ribosomal protein S20, putative [Entamoeba dispar SAW760]|eukprot:EDR22568.1 40S ribosomal protein S20, putative [Entamoeba dispar SAW760]